MRHAPVLALVLLAVTALPSLAASSTARVTGGNIAVYSGPSQRYAVIGRLADNTEVRLDYCTRNGNWCLVSGTGWVDASYLVGWSAKIGATPPDFVGPGW